MNQFYVVAQYDSLDEANVGLQVLGKLGMEQEAISLVTSTPLKHVSSRDGGVSSTLEEHVSKATFHGEVDPLAINHEREHVSQPAADELKSSSTGSAASGAGAGAALATGLALPLAVTTAVAPFFVAGPLFAAVVGAIGGAAIGASESEPTDSVAYYRELVESGTTLVIFAGNRAMALEAERGLKTTHTKSVDLIESQPPSRP